MIAGCDPYDSNALQRVDKSAGAQQTWFADILTSEQPVYPPTALLLAIPFGVRPWHPAHLLWLALTGLAFVLSVWMTWDLCADFAPLTAGLLLGSFAATSTLLLMTANPTGLATSFCVIAVWCVLRERLAMLGVVCLALSLLLKPQMSGFVWLYFMLASPLYRRFALKTLALTAAIAVPAIVWVSVMPASQHWLSELHGLVIGSLQPGGTSDPGPGNSTSFGYLNLQALFSVIRDVPSVYQLESYAVFSPILLLWGVVTAKSKASRRMSYLGIATAAALTVLPVYHRVYDVRLWLLLFPAAFLLWDMRGKRGWLALGCMAVVTGSTANPILYFMQAHHRSFYHGPIWVQLAGRPYVLLALTMTIFFLGIYVQEARRAKRQEAVGA